MPAYTEGALLDNNSYLGVKTQMTTLFVVLLLIIVLVPMLMAYYIRHMLFKMDVQKDTIDTVNRRLSKINQKLMESDLHDTRNNLWKQKAIIPFLEKITKRGYIRSHLYISNAGILKAGLSL